MSMAMRRAGVMACLALAACGRPDPMSIVQSPDEFNCLTAVREATESDEVTLLALARTSSGAEADILARDDGSVWVCRTNTAGAVVTLGRTGSL